MRGKHRGDAVSFKFQILISLFQKRKRPYGSAISSITVSGTKTPKERARAASS
jgi:hypothetical protein